MTAPHEQMWKDLGLDLVAHNMLLQVLGEGYRDIFLTQQSRPQGMDYFNFVMSEVHGLRIKELLDGKKEGKKVIGSFCVFVPEEIVRAADATLVGLCTGADFATEEVEKVLPRNTCSLIKSAFGFKLGKVCPYIESADMIVGENTCDGKKKSYEVFGKLVPNLYVMDIPQMKSPEGKVLLKAEYYKFKDRVEQLSGCTIDVAKLKNGIEIVNNKRRAVHRLAQLRKADPAPISGLDALLISQVFFYDDPIRFAQSV
ncbi:MAG: 2-hydroxyacyl-CoA dehydratase, partial [Desulfomonilaceae bacterium]